MKRKKLLFVLLMTVLLCMVFSVPASAVQKPAKVKNLTVINSGTSNHVLSWSASKYAEGYKIYCMDCSSDIERFVKIKTISNANTLNYTVKNRVPGTTYEYIIRAYRIVNGKYKHSSYSTAAAGCIPEPETGKLLSTETEESAVITNPTKSQKFKLVFGDSSLKDKLTYPGGYYTDSSLAKAAVTQITVQTWDFKKGKSGEKTTRTWTLVVNKKLAATIKQMFKELYEGSEQFPIHELGGYRWEAGHSEHNIGTAIDINWTENCMQSKITGAILCGNYWKPGVDPYSIPKTGELASIFKKYGFTQGDWSNAYDYMHFSYFGT